MNLKFFAIIFFFANLVKNAISLSSILKTFVTNRRKLKKEILDIARRTNRGLNESATDRQNIIKIFEQLEKLNPTKETLSSSLVNAIWKLEYTTSDSILGRGRNPKVGPILQEIDAIKRFAQNSEVVKYFNFIKVPQKVTAEIIPTSKTKCDVQFKRFTIGPISFNAPKSFKGTLDVTYLDEDMRLSRGDKGNYFVLTRL
jgi:hypothetical protein